MHLDDSLIECSELSFGVSSVIDKDHADISLEVLPLEVDTYTSLEEPASFRGR